MGQRWFTEWRLQQISIFQRTKAIHNIHSGHGKCRKVVANINLSKNKSNSQQAAGLNPNLIVVANINLSKNKSNSQQLVENAYQILGCSKYQSFKEQKQFTTDGKEGY